MFGLGFQPILILIGGTAGKNEELTHGFEEEGCLAEAERDDAKFKEQFPEMGKGCGREGLHGQMAKHCKNLGLNFFFLNVTLIYTYI